MNRHNIARQKNLCWQDVPCQLSIYKRPCFWTQNDPEWNKSKWSIRNTKPGPQAKLRVLEDNHSSMLLLPNKCLLTHRPLNGNKHSVPTSVPLKCLNSFVFLNQENSPIYKSCPMSHNTTEKTSACDFDCLSVCSFVYGCSFVLRQRLRCLWHRKIPIV